MGDRRGLCAGAHRLVERRRFGNRDEQPGRHQLRVGLYGVVRRGDGRDPDRAARAGRVVRRMGRGLFGFGNDMHVDDQRLEVRDRDLHEQARVEGPQVRQRPWHRDQQPRRDQLWRGLQRTLHPGYERHANRRPRSGFHIRGMDRRLRWLGSHLSGDDERRPNSDGDVHAQAHTHIDCHAEWKRLRNRHGHGDQLPRRLHTVVRVRRTGHTHCECGSSLTLLGVGRGLFWNPVHVRPEHECRSLRDRDLRSCAMKKAFITGVNGQDGSYLAELLLSKGYDVHGLIRRSSSFNTQRVEQIYHDPHESGVRFLMHYGDLSDSGSLVNLIRDLEPDEIYHLGAQSHVKVSFDVPEYTADATAMGTIRMLEAIRASGVQTRFYQASSSEMFGSAPPPQSETTPFHPRSPYGVSKVFAYWATVNYREAYSLFASNGILFNHESVRRGETFVTRKITRAVARIKAGLQDKLYLGNLEASRDWGYAPEYVEAMWRMLQQDEPDDLVIATGRGHTVQEFVELAFERVGLDWRRHIEIDPKYFRPAEVSSLCGDLSKARETLGWTARTTFEELVKLMVDGDVRLLQDEQAGRLVRVDRDH